MTPLDEAVHAARTATIEDRPGTPEVTSLVDGAVVDWISGVEEALGRLFVSGMAHPDGELAPTFEGLASRAAALGCQTGFRTLSVLALYTDALRPGPPDRSARTALCAEQWREAMQFHRWLRAFRMEIGLAMADAVSQGVTVAPAVDAVPRMSGRLFVEGLALRGDTLVVHTSTEDGAAVVLLDPLVGLDRDDPFDRPVVSRLFQEELRIRQLHDVAFDVDRHPFTVQRGVRVLRPDLRATPVRRPISGGHGRGEAYRRIRLRFDDNEALGARGGEVVELGPLLEMNAWKRRVLRGREPLEVVVRSTRQGGQILAAVERDRLVFPHLDPACWALEPTDLPLDRASAWARVAAGRDLQKTTGGWREGWVAARRGVPFVVEEPGQGPPAVWATLYCEEPTDTLWEAYRVLADPTLAEASARALLLHSQDPEAALAYLQAHLRHLRTQTERGEPLPPSVELLFAADALAWVSGADRAGPVGDALGLPAAPLRMRLVRQLAGWVESDREAGLADTLALASVSGWGRAILR